ncbi:hypothetical protein DRN34_03175 [Thermococci archaeon]|nr:MAG: hypothetical protein DRN34_03175 [Thermococci archaeon]HDD36640.1 HNH endonuclease [Archaeoglobus veneficus]
MAWKRELYPENWDEIAREIKERAGWKCENCGHPHDPENGYCLTVHHLDGNPANCRYSNLVALCQRCHLAIQAWFNPKQKRIFTLKDWIIKRNL